MRKYIIPGTMIIVPKEDLMQGLYNESAGGEQLNNGGFFDDLDDGMDNTFKTKRLWDDDEAR